jgi:FAD/FMN-containing dehydrogenase
MPNFAINRYSVGLFNFAYYFSVGNNPKKKKMYITDYFYPLDGLENWNRLYGRNGFVEYQIVIPTVSAYEIIFELLSIITRSKLASFVAAIKPLSKSLGLLSFPMDGVTFAVDFAYNKNIWQLLEKLDKIVIESGGRVYLAKDARLNANNFKNMYSGSLKKWEAIKQEYDTRNKFESVMFNRFYNS